jgi:hypothetical protein
VSGTLYKCNGHLNTVLCTYALRWMGMLRFLLKKWEHNIIIHLWINLS